MISDVIDRLQNQCKSVNNRVYGAAELATLDKTIVGQTPSIYVIPLSEQAKSRIIGEFYTDNVLITLAIVTTVRNVADNRGESAHQQLDPVRIEIKAALCGWKTSAMTNSMQYIQGRLASYDNQLLRYIDLYTTQTSFRQPIKL